MTNPITVREDQLPLRVLLIGNKKREEYILRPAGKKKFGMHLAKPAESCRSKPTSN